MGKKDLKPCLEILKKKDKDGNRLTRDSAEFKACSVKNDTWRAKQAAMTAKIKAANKAKIDSNTGKVSVRGKDISKLGKRIK